MGKVPFPSRTKVSSRGGTGGIGGAPGFPPAAAPALTPDPGAPPGRPAPGSRTRQEVTNPGEHRPSRGQGITPPPPPTPPPVIRLENVVKVYGRGDAQVRAVAGVSLDVQRGDFIAITGPSGSGKSTLMHIIGCLDTPTTGRYLLGGDDVAAMNENQLATVRNARIGFVFQQFHLLAPLSAWRNVELPLLYRRGTAIDRRLRALDALRMVGLTEYADHHPNQLSGGQQQRVAIARALVNRPEIVLADEPTGALDSRTSVEIISIFQQLNRESGITLLMVTHEPDIAAHAQRIVRFRDGRIMDDRRIATPRDAAGELSTMPSIEDASGEEVGVR